MSNAFDEMRSAVENAKMQLRAADNCAHSMAVVLKGRLRLVPVWVLVELKRELQQFDAHKKEWKS